MAFSTTSSIFFFFTILVLFSTHIHARDSYFFGKFHRESPKDNVLPLETSEKTTVKEPIPNKKDQEQDPSFVPESENGYGLYGHETTYNNNNNNNNNKYDEKVNGEPFSTPSLSETEESYNNYDEKYPKTTESYGYNNEEFNNNRYDENVKEESFSENNEDKRGFYNSNAYGTELERETPYKGYSHNLEKPQGMSDTRFMEKGNYYYDLYNDKNHGHFYQKPHRKSPAGYYSPTTENNYDQSSYSYGKNFNEENSFKDPYNSKWEKNTMYERPEEFVEEQGEQFKP